jgi:hypothetical protein
VRKGDDLTTFIVPKVEKIRSLNLPEPHGPAQARSGKALSLHLPILTSTLGGGGWLFSLPCPFTTWESITVLFETKAEGVSELDNLEKRIETQVFQLAVSSPIAAALRQLHSKSYAH